jgi:hypothetical protein
MRFGAGKAMGWRLAWLESTAPRVRELKQPVVLPSWQSHKGGGHEIVQHGAVSARADGWGHPGKHKGYKHGWGNPGRHLGWYKHPWKHNGWD